MRWLSFPRIIDVPFEICVATLEGWQRTGHEGELHIGQSLLRWPVKHDRDLGTYRIGVGLDRGPLRPPLPMTLDIARWSRLSSRTALELIPCQLVRPTPGYFRSGHLLLDSLTHLLRQDMPAQLPGGVIAARPYVELDARREAGPGSAPVTSTVKCL